MMNYVNAVLNWLATLMPGYKTQIWAASMGGVGAVLALMEYLQTVDISALIPPQYVPFAMLAIGAITSILRVITARNTQMKLEEQKKELQPNVAT